MYKGLFTAEATIQKQHVNEGIWQDATPILGSFAVKKQYYDRLIYLHLALKHFYPKIQLTPLIKVDFQSSL